LLTVFIVDCNKNSMLQLRRINLVHFLADTLIVLIGMCLSVLVFDSVYLSAEFQGLVQGALALFAFKLALLAIFGVPATVWRYFSVSDSVRILKATSTGLAVSLVFVFVAGSPLRISRYLIVDFIFTTALLCAFRLWRRVHIEKNKPGILSGRRTLIVGAGQLGRSLTQRLQSDSPASFRVIGFIDDDSKKVGRFISGMKVFGSRSDLSKLIKDLQIQEVMIAISKPDGVVVKEIFEQCLGHRIRPRTVGGNATLLRKADFKTIREIQLSDLLFRSQQNLDMDLLRSFIESRTVLITGAGGSIGSELARQVSSHNPKNLILLDHSEINLFEIERELNRSNFHSIAVLADIKDYASLENVFKLYQPEIVIHAAAYKHVHLVESNPTSAFLNNVLGTRNLVNLADKYSVKNFVLISSDKAVNPVGFMGATKRVCELIVAEKSLKSAVRFCAVRFGNVLGSSGSLVPLLQKQIENGEPITITHPDMARYFMLIPEAVSLVLTAATFAKSGDIMILKMGKPVKIIDLAKSLIRLNRKSEAEIPIVFTGIRPGEKLVEELYLCGNEIETSHSEILIAPRGDMGLGIQKGTLSLEVDRILKLAGEHKGSVVAEVMKLIANEPASEPANETINDHMVAPPGRWDEPVLVH
jgi:FlaA1/EpsC-like NDP-sugar epimerase